MRKEWTGLWVHESVWNPRHPQDFVKAIPDNPAVVPAFPDVAQVMGETTLDGDHAKDATTLTLTAVTGLEENHVIGIMLDNSVVHWTFLTDDPSGSDVTINNGLPFAATDGNAVYLPSLNNEEWQ
jgi:hypothetical protein